jgi:hypothetical protein
MMAPTTTLPDRRTVAAKPKATLLERVTKTIDGLREETSLRFTKAKGAFGAEMAWQQARRTPATDSQGKAVTVLLAGLAVDVETGDCLALQEGLNVFEKESIRVEQGRVEGSGTKASQSYFTNDTLSIGQRTYQLKLFSTDRFSRRVQLTGEDQ